MNISKREKILVGILIAVLISFGYYKFLYVKQVAKLEEVKVKRDDLENKYKAAMDSIKNLALKEEEVKILKIDTTSKARILYPAILQEKIILELDELLEKSALEANIAFNPIEVVGVEKLVSEELLKVESSLQIIVDKYNGTTSNNDENKEITNKEENENSETTSNDESESENNSSEESSEEGNSSEFTTEQLKVSLTFNGSYEQVKEFIKLVENYERKVVITNITITSQSESQLSGVMNLEFHAVPKLADEDISYLEWAIKNIYGKDILFSSDAASGAYASTIEESSNKEENPDFVMLVKSPSSELPTLTIGKAKDSLRESYIYSDNEKTEDVEITFNEDGDKIYYKYRNSESIYPTENTALGKEFTSSSKEIVVEITSEGRVLSSDISKVNLKVINNTSKDVEIIIKDDDIKDPRIIVKSEGNIVNVTKK